MEIQFSAGVGGQTLWNEVKACWRETPAATAGAETVNSHTKSHCRMSTIQSRQQLTVWGCFFPHRDHNFCCHHRTLHWLLLPPPAAHTSGVWLECTFRSRGFLGPEHCSQPPLTCSNLWLMRKDYFSWLWIGHRKVINSSRALCVMFYDCKPSCEPSDS